MGKNIALSEIYKVIPELLRTYRLELVKTEMETTGFWFFKPENIPVRVHRRA
jgi:cytochrome P450